MQLPAAWRSTIGSSSVQESFFEYLEEDLLCVLGSGRCKPEERKIVYFCYKHFFHYFRVVLRSSILLHKTVNKLGLNEIDCLLLL